MKNEQFILMPLAVVAVCAPALVGILVTTVTEAGDNNIFGVYFSVSDPATLEDKACVAASLAELGVDFAI